MRERRWPFGGMTTTPFDRTAHSIICRQPPTPKSPLLECNGTGRLRYAGAPRPVPLHHRAIRAQMCSEPTKLDRFWLEFSAPIPWLGGAESDEGLEVFGRP